MASNSETEKSDIVSETNEDFTPTYCLDTELMRDLEDILKCPICLNINAVNVFCCLNGHNICFGCYERVIGGDRDIPECPICMFTMISAPMTNLSINQIIGVLSFKIICINTSNGCKFKDIKDKIDVHEKNECKFMKCKNAECDFISDKEQQNIHEVKCDYRLIQCFGCNQNVKIKSFTNHLLDEPEFDLNLVSTKYKDSAYITTLSTAIDFDGGSPNQEWDVSTHIWNNNKFYIILEFKENKFRTCIYAINGEKNTTEFDIKISIEQDSMTLLSKKNIEFANIGERKSDVFNNVKKSFLIYKNQINLVNHTMNFNIIYKIKKKKHICNLDTVEYFVCPLYNKDVYTYKCSVCNDTIETRLGDLNIEKDDIKECKCQICSEIS